jgi:hypothetical protein
MPQDTKRNPNKVGWRISEWSDDVGVSRSYTYELLAAGVIKSVKIGSARIIVISPRDYLASLINK